MKFFIYLSGLLLVLSYTAGHAQQHPNKFTWPADGDTVIGNKQTTQVVEGQTLMDIAEDHGLGYTDIVRANPSLDPWIPEVGAAVTLPTAYVLPEGVREGIVINLAEYRLYYFKPEKSLIYTYPVGIGRDNTPTPRGAMEISARIPNPTWYPPESILKQWKAQGREVRRQIPAGPDNPLGPYAINLSLAGYLIHGTNQNFGIGTRASAGCIRMNNQDIEALVYMTQIGVPVHIIDEPVKVGVRQGKVYLEVHNVDTGSDQLRGQLRERLHSMQNERSNTVVKIDWDDVDKHFRSQQGIPESISF